MTVWSRRSWWSWNDDGFDARELALVDFRIFGKFWSAHLGSMSTDLSSGPLANLLELSRKSSSVILPCELALQSAAPFIDGCPLFDERHEVAHAKHGDDALGIKTFQGVVFFREADKLTGAPVTLPMEAAAPPRASPSSLVRITPEAEALVKSPAERTAP